MSIPDKASVWLLFVCDCTWMIQICAEHLLKSYFEMGT